MDSNSYSCEHAEEDYIDMEVGSQSSATIMFNSSSSSSSHFHQAREFEFQMSGRDTAPSPADELFYKGKLLPLHLPPRLQMVEKLVQNSTTYDYNFDDSFSTPFFTPTSNNTPFESCQVSGELNPQDYFLEYSSSSSLDLGTSSFALFSDQENQNHTKKSWTTKLKLIKDQYSFGPKLKASRAYLKSLFNKTACSTETSASAAAASSRNFNQGSIMKAKETSNKFVRKNNPFGQIQKSVVVKQESLDENGGGSRGGGGGGHRRSFSGAIIKRISMNTSSSSSSLSSSVCSSSVSSLSSASTSTDSNGFRELQFFKRSNSVNSDIENPIQAAIAHCKRSQHQEKQQIHSRKNVRDNGFCSLSAARVVVHHEEQRPALCRG